jgi:hypothetical protein
MHFSVYGVLKVLIKLGGGIMTALSHFRRGQEINRTCPVGGGALAI